MSDVAPPPESGLEGCKTAVLFLIYNRLDLSLQVFRRIREARPAHLLIAADGPRKGRPGDEESCRNVREQVLKFADWPCQVETRFSEVNQGCKLGVTSALEWAFARHDRLIIVEDDCLPDPSFFPFCDELLERFADDSRVMQISGSNLTGLPAPDGASYYSSRFGSIWGWATWRRAFKHFDVGMNQWPRARRSESWRRACPFPGEIAWREKIYTDVASGRLDAWSYQWDFARQMNHGISLVPSTNLISNIGWGAGATHTHATNDPRAGLPVSAMPFPLIHAGSLNCFDAADRSYFTQHCTELSLPGRALRKLGKIWRNLSSQTALSSL